MMDNETLALDRPAPKPNRYRPYTPFDENMKARFLEYLGQGYSMVGAATKAGTSPQVAWYHRQNDPDFDEAVRLAYTETGTAFYEDLMRDKALDSKWGFLANMSILKARDPARWNEKKQVDINLHGQVDMFLIADAVHQVQAPQQGQIVPGEYTEVVQEAHTDVRDSADGAHNEASYDGNDFT